ncbi:MAG: carbonic anhydrase [Pirellulales bacterium]
MAVQELVAGVHHFRTQVFSEQRELFERLAGGQEPDTLFITCSDSRIDPNLITNTQPGSLFILRNAGNLVPAYGASNGGETATIEFAIRGLAVKDIIICGHSLCGAMKGLLHPELTKDMPTVAKWLEYAETTRQIVKAKYTHLSDKALLEATVEENVLTQIENIQTHPAVAVGLMQGTVNIHAWFYEIETGHVHAYDAASAQYKKLGESRQLVAHPAPPVLHMKPQKSTRSRKSSKS